MRKLLAKISWPRLIPKWFWEFARWRLGTGEFKPYGPANPLYRPESAPKKIPKWAWERLKLLIPKPIKPSYNGLLNGQGLWIRNPHGGVEDIDQMAEAGFKWLGLNVGDYDESEYDLIRSRCIQYGLKVIPWARVWNESVVAKLVNVANKWNSQSIGYNLEDEAKDSMTPARSSGLLLSLGWNKEVITFAVAWLYNSVNWKPLAKLGPVTLQIFPSESDAATRPNDCVAHAKELGFANVFQTFGSHHGAQPNWYNLNNKPYNIYTADNIGQGNYKNWNP